MKNSNNQPTVVLDELYLNHDQLVVQIIKHSESIGLNKDLEGGKTVFIKPNLTYPQYKEGVTTRVEFVHALVDGILSMSPKSRIIIGEGEGGYNSFSMTKAMKDMGFYDLCTEDKRVVVQNLSELPVKDIELMAFGKPYHLQLPALFFDEVDFSISCPLPKVHCMTKLTLSFKNQWGCLPDIMRLKNHYVFDEIIGQVNHKLKFKYAFLDGKIGLDNNGPMVGYPVRLNWFVASNSLGAFDITLAKLMGTNWRSIGHLKRAKAYGFLPDEKEINIVGNLDDFKRKFTLKRDFWNYPALFAFKSKRLTTLFYLSRWSKILHDIMYTFRKRPI